MQHLTYVRYDRTRHGDISIRMMGNIMIARSPRTPSRQYLMQSQSIPMCIGRTTQHLSSLYIHIEQYRIMICQSTHSASAEHTTQRCNILYSTLLGNIQCTTRLCNDTKGTQWCILGQMLRHPVTIQYPLLNDPITTISRIPIKMNAQSPLLIPMLDHNCRTIQIRTHRHITLGSLFQKCPLILHLIPRRNIIQQGMHTRHTAIQSPVRKPIVWCQKSYRVLVRDGGFATCF
mmetsp:Transcript_11821/g.17871  ORF Transcript_11821/g.17871 Transcript_11821/m.17871 type:complete len:232 (+) Transcript_11821:284-979(+)